MLKTHLGFRESHTQSFCCLFVPVSDSVAASPSVSVSEIQIRIHIHRSGSNSKRGGEAKRLTPRAQWIWDWENPFSPSFEGFGGLQLIYFRLISFVSYVSAARFSGKTHGSTFIAHWQELCDLLDYSQGCQGKDMTESNS